MKQIKVSEAAKRDFEFFLATPLDMLGETDADVVVVGLNASSDGKTALECWYMKDTMGRSVACREPDVLKKAIRGKKSWNLQIKLWADDLGGELPILCQRELADMTTHLPWWIFEATCKQAGRKASARIGFVPRRLRIEFFMSQLWLPDMDRFDPAI